MFRLYWKIFLGFWLTGFVLAAFAIVVNQQLSQNPESEIAGLNPKEVANRTSFILRRLPDEASSWQASLLENDIRLYTRRERRNSISDVTAPEAIEELFALLQVRGSVESQTLTSARIGRRVESINSETVYYVLDMPGAGISGLRELAGQVTAQFALSMFISAIACWVLARYLTRNLEKIRQATQRLALGDLSARIEIPKRFTRDELDALAAEFNHMANALESSMKNQRRLVRDVSHELRSPLARLQIALELARTKEPNKQLDRIEQEATRLNDMIGQLLAMPDAEMPLEDCVDLIPMLSEIVEHSRIEADTRGIVFTTNFAIEEALVAANATQLHSALENIIRNAIRYNRDGEVIEVIVENYSGQGAPNSIGKPELQSQTTLKSVAGGDHFSIIVKDNGPGIPEEDLPHIFKPFYRVDPSRTRKTGGYGIGLAIVGQVVTAHGGLVKATNWERGLLMSVTLPSYQG